MTWDELFMRQVYLIASKSKDTRTKIVRYWFGIDT